MPSFSDNNQQTNYELSGLAFKICTAAFIDFSKKLDSYSKEGTELEVFISQIENYQIKIKSTDAFYSVTFSLKPFKGSYLKGGGAFYKIDKKTFKIVKKIYYK